MIQPSKEIPLYTNIQRLCAEKHISIAALERKAGIGNGVIRKWNAVSPTLRTLMAVAACLNVTLDELITQ